MSEFVSMSGYERVYATLAAMYGLPTWRPGLPPMDELVSTILSQNTNDRNRDLAFERLQTRFGRDNWEEVRDAASEQVIEAIRPAGLAPQKGPRIQNALRQISQHRGQLSLDFLAGMPLEEAREWLTALPGVGPKTAAIVLLFALGQPAFPVDTHVHRVTGRLGWVPRTFSAEKAQVALEAAVPPDHFYALHINLIRHGRAVCLARRPRCGECALRPDCRYGLADGGRVDP